MEAGHGLKGMDDRSQTSKKHITAHIDGSDWAAWRKKNGKGLEAKVPGGKSPKHCAPRDVLSISTRLYEGGLLSKTNTAWGMSILEWARGLDPGGLSANMILELRRPVAPFSSGSFCILS